MREFDIAEAIAEAIEEGTQEVLDQFNDELEAEAYALCNEISEEAPRSEEPKAHYADAWRVKKNKNSDKYTVYNNYKDDQIRYALPYILEYGRRKRGSDKKDDAYDPQPHIFKHVGESYKRIINKLTK